MGSPPVTFPVGVHPEYGGAQQNANGIAMWHPLREFEKKGLKKLYYKDGKVLGSQNILLRECKIPNAWYCASCNKVAGIFDITVAE